MPRNCITVLHSRIQNLTIFRRLAMLATWSDPTWHDDSTWFGLTIRPEIFQKDLDSNWTVREWQCLVPDSCIQLEIIVVVYYHIYFWFELDLPKLFDTSHTTEVIFRFHLDPWVDLISILAQCEHTAVTGVNSVHSWSIHFSLAVYRGMVLFCSVYFRFHIHPLDRFSRSPFGTIIFHSTKKSTQLQNAAFENGKQFVIIDFIVWLTWRPFLHNSEVPDPAALTPARLELLHPRPLCFVQNSVFILILYIQFSDSDFVISAAPIKRAMYAYEVGRKEFSGDVIIDRGRRGSPNGRSLTLRRQNAERGRERRIDILHFVRVVILPPGGVTGAPFLPRLAIVVPKGARCHGIKVLFIYNHRSTAAMPGSVVGRGGRWWRRSGLGRTADPVGRRNTVLADTRRALQEEKNALYYPASATFAVEAPGCIVAWGAPGRIAVWGGAWAFRGAREARAIDASDE